MQNEINLTTLRHAMRESLQHTLADAKQSSPFLAQLLSGIHGLRPQWEHQQLIERLVALRPLLRSGAPDVSKWATGMCLSALVAYLQLEAAWGREQL